MDQSWTGLPDGIFSNLKSRFGYIFEDLEMENVGIFNGFLDYMFYDHLIYI
jgi:hypothetical protein